MPRVLSDEDIAAFREKLCDAAAKLFAEKGHDGVTMRELANKLGVSAMTPYRYFRDKNEILAAVRAGAFNRFSQSLEDAYDNTQGTMLERALARREAYIRFALAEPDSYRLMFDLYQPGECDYPHLMRAMERARHTMTSHLDEMIAQGFIVGDALLLGHVFWAMMHGVVTLKLAGKLCPEYSVEQILNEGGNLLGAGLRARKEAKN